MIVSAQIYLIKSLIYVDTVIKKYVLLTQLHEYKLEFHKTDYIFNKLYRDINTLMFKNLVGMFIYFSLNFYFTFSLYTSYLM